MAINPINVTRVTQNLRVDHLVNSLRTNQVDLFTTQARIASGRRFITPSEDPVAAAQAIDLTQALGRQRQFTENLQFADNVLAASDEAITEINSLLIEASSIASQHVGSLSSPAERAAEAQLVAGIRQQLVNVGNRQFEGRYIFAGRDTTEAPFVNLLGGVAYLGDTGDLITRTDDHNTAVTNVPGNVLFGALSSRIAASVDLTPALRASARLDEIQGARGELLSRGTLVFNEIGGAGSFTVDLGGVDTIGDVVDRINEKAAEQGAALHAAVTDTGLEITPGALPVSITDTSAGAVASNYGILTAKPTDATIAGQPLISRVTRTTQVADLARAAGIDLASGFIINNGSASAQIDLSTAETVQDIINIINNSGVGVLAQINDAGTGIDLFNRVSGSSMTVGENGGTTASDLGIRTLNEVTPLSKLNFGLGFETQEGRSDLRITAKNGAFVDVNLDGAATVGDVIALINAAATTAGVSITASLAAVGNGIQIADQTGGTGALSASALNASTAPSDLGLVKTVDPTLSVLVGDDTNPTRTDGVLGALTDLETAMLRDDTPGIARAAARLDEFSPEVTRVHGQIGAMSSAMQANLHQMENAAQTTGVFLSEVRDLDYAEAATRMQSALTQLQASYQTSSLLLNLSLMDFLG